MATNDNERTMWHNREHNVTAYLHEGRYPTENAIYEVFDYSDEEPDDSWVWVFGERTADGDDEWFSLEDGEEYLALVEVYGYDDNDTLVTIDDPTSLDDVPQGVKKVLLDDAEVNGIEVVL